jgi:hypothetical protein
MVAGYMSRIFLLRRFRAISHFVNVTLRIHQISQRLPAHDIITLNGLEKSKQATQKNCISFLSGFGMKNKCVNTVFICYYIYYTSMNLLNLLII